MTACFWVCSTAYTSDVPALDIPAPARSQGWKCLTGNSKEASLNLATEGCYTYRDERFDREYFPSYAVHRVMHGDMGPGQADIGGTNGWIAIAKGSLTDGARSNPASIMFPSWIKARKINYDADAPGAHVVIFDLKKDYYIKQVEIECPNKGWSDVVLWVRPEERKDFVMVDRFRGPGLLERPERSGKICFTNVDSLARFLRLRFEFLEEAHYVAGSHPKQFGIDEIRIWGEEQGRHTAKDIKPFLWKNGYQEKALPNVPQYIPPKGVAIVPWPREIKITDGMMPVNQKTRILYGGSDKGKGMADWLSRQISLMTGLRLETAKDDGKRENAILLGDVTTSPELKTSAMKKGLSFAEGKPGSLGYVLSIDPASAFIIGKDPAGIFNGMQTLLQLIRWNGNGSLVFLKCAAIVDWPRVLDRMASFKWFGPDRLAGREKILRMYSLIKYANVGFNQVFLGGHSAKWLDDGRIRHMAGTIGKEEISATEQLFRDYFFDSRPAVPISDIGPYEEGELEIPPDMDWKGLAKDPSVLPCPAGPFPERFFKRLDEAMKIAPGSGYIYIGFPFGNGTNAYWNVCRRCQARNMSAAGLMVDFIKQISAHCHKHGRSPIFYNIGQVSYQLLMNRQRFPWAGREFLERLPRDIGIVVCNSYMYNEMKNIGFQYVEILVPSEINISVETDFSKVEGDVNGLFDTYTCDLTGAWMAANSQIFPIRIATAEYFWRGDNPSEEEMALGDRIQRARERMGEIYSDRFYPSLMPGMERRYFTINLKPHVNWSHIDETAGDGRGWLDYGPNYDLRRLPAGQIKLQGDAPFEIIDPGANNGKSIIAVANERPELRQGNLPNAVKIPIQKKAASLLFLEAAYTRAAFYYPNLTLVHAYFSPVYRIVYKDNTYELLESEAMKPRQWDKLHSTRLCDWDYTKVLPIADKVSFFARKEHLLSLGGDNHGETLGGARHGWLGHTESGDECLLYIQEWVNPWPEKEVAYVECFFPYPEIESDFTHAIFAVTGTEVTTADLQIWQTRDRRSLPNLAGLQYPADEEGKPVFSGGTFKEVDKQVYNYLDSNGNKTAAIDLGTTELESDRGIKYPLDAMFSDDHYGHLGEFSIKRSVPLKPVQITFMQPVNLCRIALRGRYRFVPWNRGASFAIPFLKVDVKVEGLSDGNTWRALVEDQGLIGEEGVRNYVIKGEPITCLRLSVDARNHLWDGYDYHTILPGISYLGLFEKHDGK